MTCVVGGLGVEGARAGGNFRSYLLQEQPNSDVLTNHKEARVCKEYQGTKQKLCDKHQKRNSLCLDGSRTWDQQIRTDL